MPLIQGSSPKSMSKNIATEMHAGKPQNQSLAIAYSIKRRNAAKKARGGMIQPENEMGEHEMESKDQKMDALDVYDACMAEGGEVEGDLDLDEQLEDLDSLEEPELEQVHNELDNPMGESEDESMSDEMAHPKKRLLSRVLGAISRAHKGM